MKSIPYETDFRNQSVHSGVLTDGNIWEFYTFHTLPHSTSAEDNSQPTINLYTTGRITAVDRKSRTDIFGISIATDVANSFLGLLTYFTGGFTPAANNPTVWIVPNVSG